MKIVKRGFRKCKNCKKVFEKKKPLQFVCSPKCAIEYSSKKEKAKREKEQKARKKEILDDLKTLSELKKDLQKLVNKAVRVIDQNFPCVSCQKESNRYDAGHFHSTGAQKAIQFHFLNIWKQCSFNCNKSLSGNILNYQNEIERIYGKAFLSYLRHEIIQEGINTLLSKEDVREAIKTMRNELKTLKPALTNEERMKKRIELNEKLGIYDSTKSI